MWPVGNVIRVEDTFIKKIFSLNNSLRRKHIKKSSHGKFLRWQNLDYSKKATIEVYELR